MHHSKLSFSQLKLGLTVLFLTLVLGVVIQNVGPTPTAKATPTPASCFSYTTTGNEVTITGYYNNEANNSANPSCPRDVNIPATINGNPVVTIGNSAFRDNQLTSVNIPSGVTSIGDFAFIYNQLTNVTIPSSVTSIGNSAFQWNQLASATIPGSVTSIGNLAFSYNQLTSVTIPSSVTSIDNAAFTDNQLTSVTIPSSVASIGNAAFSNNQLTSVTIADGVASIGYAAFSRNQLTNVTIPGSVDVIGGDAFALNKLTSVVILDGTTEIGSYAFYHNQITDVSLPDSLKTIESEAFTLNRISSLTVPNSLDLIEVGAFAAQNPWGSKINEGDDPEIPYIWSDDPSIVQQAYDSIWYVRLYTKDPSNPSNLQHGITSEDNWTWRQDANNNGTTRDSLGGHIINPSRLEIRALDKSGGNLLSPSVVTGVKPDGTPLTDYLVSKSGNFAPIDPWDITPEEQAAIDAGLGQYYRLGQTLSVTAPVVAGYPNVSPSSPLNLELTLPTTTATFTYSKPLPPAPEPKPTPTPTPKPAPKAPVVIKNPVKTSKPAATPKANETADRGNGASPDDRPTPLTVINFSDAPNSSSGHPATPVPDDVAPELKTSRFSTDRSSACSTISSASLLSPAGFADSNVSLDATVLGGLDFSLKCNTAGKDARVSLALSQLTDNEKTLQPDGLRVYKQTKDGKVTDITNQVQITDSMVDGENRTVLSYSLTDGGPLDDDGEVNGEIVDPIYLVDTAEKAAATAPTEAATDSQNVDDDMTISVWFWVVLSLAAVGLVWWLVARRFAAKN